MPALSWVHRRGGQHDTSEAVRERISWQVSQGDFLVIPTDRGDSAACTTLSWIPASTTSTKQHYIALSSRFVVHLQTVKISKGHQIPPLFKLQAHWNFGACRDSHQPKYECDPRSRLPMPVIVLMVLRPVLCSY